MQRARRRTLRGREGKRTDLPASCGERNPVEMVDGSPWAVPNRLAETVYASVKRHRQQSLVVQFISTPKYFRSKQRICLILFTAAI
jgi:hypothetical protein